VLLLHLLPQQLAATQKQQLLQQQQLSRMPLLQQKQLRPPQQLQRRQLQQQRLPLLPLPSLCCLSVWRRCYRCSS
jgi:hypothetical protein